MDFTVHISTIHSFMTRTFTSHIIAPFIVTIDIGGTTMGITEGSIMAITTEVTMVTIRPELTLDTSDKWREGLEAAGDSPL